MPRRPGFPVAISDPALHSFSVGSEPESSAPVSEQCVDAGNFQSIRRTDGMPGSFFPNGQPLDCASQDTMLRVFDNRYKGRGVGIVHRRDIRVSKEFAMWVPYANMARSSRTEPPR